MHLNRSGKVKNIQEIMRQFRNTAFLPSKRSAHIFSVWSKYSTGNNSWYGSMITLFVFSTGREGEEKEMASLNKKKTMVGIYW